MKKILILIVSMMLLVFGLTATITYSSITKIAVNKFEAQYGTTTVAVADTAANYILSPTFTEGYRISNKSIMVVGTVTTSLLHSAGTAVGKLKCVIQVSSDGTNYVDWASADAYMSSAATAGTVITVPVSLSGVWAPYIRIKWVGYSAAGVLYTAKIYGVIQTRIILPPT